MDNEIKTFIKERNEALLSLDEEKIRALYRTYNGQELPTEPIIFWGSVHKAITGIQSLPIEFRRASKKWLNDRLLRSHDDGDL